MNPSQTNALRPLGLGPSLLLFGIPAVILYAFVYLGIPALETAGATPMNAYLIALGIPLFGMFVAALVAYRIEGNPPGWVGLKARFRLHPMTGRDWLWTIAITLLCLLSFGFIPPLESALIQAGIIPLPNYIPAALRPTHTISPEALAALTGGTIQGNWGMLSLYFVMLFFNIFGEEFWWRGYILPRQELAFGRWTWLVHGVLWTLFHAFKWWNYLTLLPVTLAISYMAQKRQNNTTAIIAHYVVNGLGWLGFLAFVLGAGS